MWCIFTHIRAGNKHTREQRKYTAAHSPSVTFCKALFSCTLTLTWQQNSYELYSSSVSGWDLSVQRNPQMQTADVFKGWNMHELIKNEWSKLSLHLKEYLLFISPFRGPSAHRRMLVRRSVVVPPTAPGWQRYREWHVSSKKPRCPRSLWRASSSAEHPPHLLALELDDFNMGTHRKGIDYR